MVQEYHRILLVDDHAELRARVRLHLEFEGWSVDEAEDGPSALERFQQERQDLVLLDYWMPGMDGHAVLLSLRRVDPEVPVVMITGEIGGQLPIQMFRDGVDDFVQKPLDLDYLKEVIIPRALRRRQILEAETARKALEETGRLKTELITNINHITRTPLHAGFAFLKEAQKALDMNRVERAALYLAKAREGFDGLGEVLVDITRFSELETGRLSLDPVLQPVGPLLRDIVADIEFQARQRDICIGLQCPPGLEALIDADLFGELVNRLLENAVHFSPTGGSIDVRAVENGECLALSISDQGPGIAKSRQEILFQPFSPISGDLPERGGRGLELAIAWAAARSLGGRIQVENHGAGLRLTVLLPNSPPPRGSQPREEEASQNISLG